MVHVAPQVLCGCLTLNEDLNGVSLLGLSFIYLFIIYDLDLLDLCLKKITEGRGLVSLPLTEEPWTVDNF